MISALLSDSYFFFFFNDTATTEIYTLSLHDALPICSPTSRPATWTRAPPRRSSSCTPRRSEEHTSELQSPDHLVCRLLLEKKNERPGRLPATELGLRCGHAPLWTLAGGALGGRAEGVFFFNDTATTEIYTLSLHDALPIFFMHAP